MTRAAPLGEECGEPITSGDWGTLLCSRPIGHDDSHEAVFFESMVEAQSCHRCKKLVRWHRNYIYDVFSCWDHLRRGHEGDGEGQAEAAEA